MGTVKRSFSSSKAYVRLRQAIRRFADLLRNIYERCVAWVKEYKAKVKVERRPSHARNGKPLKSWERLNGAR